MINHNLFSVIASSGEFFELSNAHHAYIYYKNKRINILTNEEEKFVVQDWIDSLCFEIDNHQFNNRILHLFYEMGYLFNNLESLFADDCILGIDLSYGQSKKITLKKDNKKIELEEIYKISFKDYELKFRQGYKELERGNCYQFNLTSEFKYKFNHNLSPIDFIQKLWSEKKNIGAFASATYIKDQKMLYLSNSPECLFKYENDRLETFPIKGTVKNHSKNSTELENAWKKLVNDQKNEAELYMITDLLRNDLSRIDLPRAEVITKKKMLLVPGLIHQYAHINVLLRKHVSFKRVVECVFPGGSITGAPKRRSMELIDKLEDSKRGFYCGSTILLFKHRVSASINIRSSEIDFNSYTLSYRSGGGITLKSNPFEEYNEMLEKKNSFLGLLNR